jgi:hypothetical protein
LPYMLVVGNTQTMSRAVGMRELQDRLQRVGYQTAFNTHEGFMIVIFDTRQGYRAFYTVWLHEVEDPHIFDSIVYKMNSVIKEDL